MKRYILIALYSLYVAAPCAYAQSVGAGGNVGGAAAPASAYSQSRSTGYSPGGSSGQTYNIRPERTATTATGGNVQNSGYQAPDRAAYLQNYRNDGGSANVYYAANNVNTGTARGNVPITWNSSTANVGRYTGSLNSRPGIHPSEPRYNYAARDSYPYYTSDACKKKSKAHADNKACINYLGNIPWIPLADPYYSAWYFAGYMQWQVLDDMLQPWNSALYASLDGYIVYGEDTLSGVVTVADRSVYLEQVLDAATEYGYNADYADSMLNEVVVFKGNRELHLARILPGDKQLYRVLHTGRLNIYDDSYCLLSGNNINRAHIKVVSGGRVSEIENKDQLLEQVNAAYGMHLKHKGMTWAKLLDIIDTLDR